VVTLRGHTGCTAQHCMPSLQLYTTCLCKFGLGPAVHVLHDTIAEDSQQSCSCVCIVSDICRLSNNVTYTPMDDPLDWLLAKAYTNALSTSDVAAVHFINSKCALHGVRGHDVLQKCGSQTVCRDAGSRCRSMHPPPHIA